ncbi:putative dna damage response protein wss1 [Erysiphe necator]|uniref:Putative dna damage response protein wss1 n=1 Tax=Uncinula necator TaxID=52586 RepID=A0A0B1P3G7_UNCNE|nr:putative dna damage response protein wss1 [Erysiphe necator]
MMNQDVLISRYAHLDKFPREKEAIFIIKKVASLVRPIMRARSWRVGTLTEFYPEQHNLLGLNYGQGNKICLRLRYAEDKNRFLPFENITDTMLHELCHNVYGPHDEKFHALWDQLRVELEELVSKGYTGEGFLSEGHRLGGHKLGSGFDPRVVARRAAAAAEQRQMRARNSYQRFNNMAIPVLSDMRNFVLSALQRRGTIIDGCGSRINNAREIEFLANQAIRNGFTSKAEEDEANDRAISQVLWELEQEDMANTKSNSTVLSSYRRPQQPKTNTLNMMQPSQINSRSSSHMPRTKSNGSWQNSTNGWSCPTCTLQNPMNFLACEACNMKRPAEISRQFTSVQ